MASLSVNKWNVKLSLGDLTSTVTRFKSITNVLSEHKRFTFISSLQRSVFGVILVLTRIGNYN